MPFSNLPPELFEALKNDELTPGGLGGLELISDVPTLFADISGYGGMRDDEKITLQPGLYHYGLRTMLLIYMLTDERSDGSFERQEFIGGWYV